MSKRLFIGGLSWNTDDAALHTAFARFGEVAEAQVVLDRETSRSRGFGFVTYKDDKAAQSAIQEMDGGTLDGRQLRVNEAHERSRGGGGAANDRW
jgi:RNA recognition motif-containing protein